MCPNLVFYFSQQDIRASAPIVRIFSLCLAGAVTSVTFNVSASFVPVWQEVFKVSANQIGFLTIFSYLGYAIATIVAGFLLRRYRTRLVVVVVLSILSTFTLLMPLLPSFPWLLFYQVVVGLTIGVNATV